MSFLNVLNRRHIITRYRQRRSTWVATVLIFLLLTPLFIHWNRQLPGLSKTHLLLQDYLNSGMWDSPLPDHANVFFQSRFNFIKFLDHGQQPDYLIHAKGTEDLQKGFHMGMARKAHGHTTPRKTIVQWGYDSSPVDMSKCRVHNCEFIPMSSDGVWQSDLIIFISIDLYHVRQLPKTRYPHQRWVFLSTEAPQSVAIKAEQFNNVFNWTATYRLDSDFRTNYGHMMPRDQMSNNELTETIAAILKQKTRFIAARISNCDADNNRLEYVRELQKYINVDIYGKCGDMDCPRGDPACEVDLMRTYKFYLSFENSNCRDYITEKFWQPLTTWNSVPVAMGGSHVLDYDAVAPPGSFLHVKQFSDAKHLATFLKIVNNSQDLYAEYFAWRRDFDVRLTPGHDGYCRMCAALHNEKLPSQTYSDFAGWYGQDVCRQAVSEMMEPGDDSTLY